MINGLSHVSIVVKDHDEAIRWYRDKMGLQIHTDSMCGDMRWVTMMAEGQKDLEIVLYLASPEEKDPRLQHPGHVASWVFSTDDCRKEIEEMRQKGVSIIMEPNDAPWGTQAMIEDLYGNTFVIVTPREFTQEEMDQYDCKS